MTLYRIADGVAWRPWVDALDRPSDRPTALNDLIGFDTPPVLVTVGPDGVVTLDTNAPDAPRGLDSLYADEDDHADADLVRQARAAGWELVTGQSGQHGYAGPVMHPSEYIGGGIVDLIAGDGDDTPRRTWWTVVVVDYYVHEDEDDDPEPEPSGWVLLYRTAPWSCSSCGATIAPDDGGALWYHADNMSMMCDGDESTDLTRQATP